MTLAPLFVLAGGLMVTRWDEFPVLVPFALVGALLGWSLVALLRRLGVPLAHGGELGIVAVAAVLLALGPADIYWAGWQEERFLAGIVGGMLALLTAAGVGVLVGMASLAAVRALYHRLRGRAA